MKYINQQLIKLARMASSRVILVCLFIYSLSNAYSITIDTKTATINITLKESRKPVPDDNLVGKAIISHQPYENRTCFPESWNMLLKQRMITVPNNKCSPVEILKCYCLTSESISSDVDNGSLQNMNVSMDASVQYRTIIHTTKFILLTSWKKVNVLCLIVKAYSVVSVRMDMGLLSTPSVSSVLNVVTVPTGLVFLSIF